MTDDPRCCGSGTCIIDEDGRCWCGQRWDGNQLLGPAAVCLEPASSAPGDAKPITNKGPAEHNRA